LFARHVSRHLRAPHRRAGQHAGANGLVGANYLYNTAPRDGTAIGLLYQAIAQDQVVLGPKVQYDVRQFNWIGRITSTAEILYCGTAFR
jgi:tripartite-type tricarboxylate transporter receptor subunit TctC